MGVRVAPCSKPSHFEGAKEGVAPPPAGGSLDADNLACPFVEFSLGAYFPCISPVLPLTTLAANELR